MNVGYASVDERANHIVDVAGDAGANNQHGDSRAIAVLHEQYQRRGQPDQ